MKNNQLREELKKRITLSVEMHDLVAQAFSQVKDVEVEKTDTNALMTKMHKAGELKELIAETGRQTAGLEATLIAAAEISKANAAIVVAEAQLAGIHAMETGVPAKALLEFKKDIIDFFLAMAKNSNDITITTLANAMQTKLDLDFIGQQDNRTNLGGVNRLEGGVVVGDQDNSIDNSVKKG